MTGVYLVAVPLWMLFVLGGAYVGGKRGNASVGASLGFLLGPVGVLAALVVPMRPDPPMAKWDDLPHVW